jgi:hypothetical protein
VLGQLASLHDSALTSALSSSWACDELIGIICCEIEESSVTERALRIDGVIYNFEELKS